MEASTLHRRAPTSGEGSSESTSTPLQCTEFPDDAVTMVADSRAWMVQNRHLYHTVSTSTPTDKRLARVRDTMDAAGDRIAVAPLPPRRPSAAHDGNQYSSRVAWSTVESAHHDGDGGYSDWGETRSSQHESKSDEQRAGEDTITRTVVAAAWQAVSRPGSCAGGGSSTSSVVCSNEQTRVAGSNHVRNDVVASIATLKALLDEGFISQQEFDRRKRIIIDDLTFGSNAPSLRRSEVRTEQRRPLTPQEGLPLIVPHAPIFASIAPEVATKHVFDYDTRQWTTSQVYVALDETPFSKGSLRMVYHLQDLNEVNFTGSYVAKVAIDPDEDPQTYFRDIELQAHCAYYADLYNSYHPPKRVEFLKAWVLELTERGGVLCAVEEYIPGDYRKHNNNFGSVSDDERNTPQAFSHFTYEASNHELLAVDIQGVGDKYTDPQIHTLNGHDFGKGNLGALGFQKFLSSHRCNSICRYLKLPQVNPKDRHADRGTLPLQELMNNDRVRSARFDSRHYYEQAPMLQKYIAHCRELEEQEQEHNLELERRSRRQGMTFDSFCRPLAMCGCAIQ